MAAGVAVAKGQGAACFVVAVLAPSVVAQGLALIVAVVLAPFAVVQRGALVAAVVLAPFALVLAVADMKETPSPVPAKTGFFRV